MRAWLLLFPLLVSACESGLLRTLDVTVPSAVSSQLSESAPAVLVSDLSGEARPYVVLCGQALKQPLVLSHDLGFGCLKEKEGVEETVRAWLEPLSALGDLTCTAQRDFYRSLSGQGVDAGTTVLADAPAPTWVQGSGTGTWRRDVSPCGGSLRATATLAAP